MQGSCRQPPAGAHPLPCHFLCLRCHVSGWLTLTPDSRPSPMQGSCRQPPAGAHPLPCHLLCLRCHASGWLTPHPSPCSMQSSCQHPPAFTAVPAPLPSLARARKAVRPAPGCACMPDGLSLAICLARVCRPGRTCLWQRRAAGTQEPRAARAQLTRPPPRRPGVLRPGADAAGHLPAPGRGVLHPAPLPAAALLLHVRAPRCCQDAPCMRGLHLTGRAPSSAASARDLCECTSCTRCLAVCNCPD